MYNIKKISIQIVLAWNFSVKSWVTRPKRRTGRPISVWFQIPRNLVISISPMLRFPVRIITVDTLQPRLPQIINAIPLLYPYIKTPSIYHVTQQKHKNYDQGGQQIPEIILQATRSSWSRKRCFSKKFETKDDLAIHLVARGRSAPDPIFLQDLVVRSVKHWCKQ